MAILPQDCLHHIASFLKPHHALPLLTGLGKETYNRYVQERPQDIPYYKDRCGFIKALHAWAALCDPDNLPARTRVECICWPQLSEWADLTVILTPQHQQYNDSVDELSYAECINAVADYMDICYHNKQKQNLFALRTKYTSPSYTPIHFPENLLHLGTHVCQHLGWTFRYKSGVSFGV